MTVIGGRAADGCRTAADEALSAVCMASIRCTRCVNHLTGNHTRLAVARRPVIWLQTGSRLVAQSLITALLVKRALASQMWASYEL